MRPRKQKNQHTDQKDKDEEKYQHHTQNKLIISSHKNPMKRDTRYHTTSIARMKGNFNLLASIVQLQPRTHWHMTLGDDPIIFSARRHTQINLHLPQELTTYFETSRTSKTNKIRAFLHSRIYQSPTAIHSPMQRQTVQEQKPSFITAFNVLPPSPMDVSLRKPLMNNVTLTS